MNAEFILNRYHFLLISVLFLNSCKDLPREISVMKKEEEFLKSVQKKFKAQDLKITELQEFDSIIKNSIHVDFINATYNLEDTTTNDRVSEIIDSVIAILDDQYKYHLIYKKAAVSFTQERSNFLAGKSKRILRYKMIVPGAINEELYHNRQIRFTEKVKRLEKQKKIDSLKYICKKIPKSDSLYLSALGFLGQIAGKEMDTNSFIYYFKEMRKTQKNDEFITITLAKVYGDKMDYITGMKYIDTTLSINNRNAYAYYYRGLYEFYTTNNKKKVIADMEKAKKLGHDDAGLFLHNIEMYYNKK